MKAETALRNLRSHLNVGLSADDAARNVKANLASLARSQPAVDLKEGTDCPPKKISRFWPF